MISLLITSYQKKYIVFITLLLKKYCDKCIIKIFQWQVVTEKNLKSSLTTLFYSPIITGNI